MVISGNYNFSCRVAIFHCCTDSMKCGTVAERPGEEGGGTLNERNKE